MTAFTLLIKYLNMVTKFLISDIITRKKNNFITAAVSILFGYKIQ